MNTSSAVRQQRLDRSPDALDDYPTPPWATRALVEKVLLPTGLPHTRGVGLASSTVWEPAANRGYMAKPLKRYFGYVIASDIKDYGVGFRTIDFLSDSPVSISTSRLWVITNPPFVKAHEFIDRARTLPRWCGTALFVRMAFLEGLSGRYERLFRDNPPTIVASFSERVVLHQGVMRDPDQFYIDAATGKRKKPSTATAYVWLVWINGVGPMPPVWIPPCRRELTRPGDYPAPT